MQVQDASEHKTELNSALALHKDVEFSIFTMILI